LDRTKILVTAIGKEIYKTGVICEIVEIVWTMEECD